MRCRTPCSMLMLSLKDKLFFSSHVVRRFLLLFIRNSLPFSNINKLVIFPFQKFFYILWNTFSCSMFYLWMKFCKIKFIEELRFCLWIPSDCFKPFFLYDLRNLWTAWELELWQKQMIFLTHKLNKSAKVAHFHKKAITLYSCFALISIYLHPRHTGILPKWSPLKWTLSKFDFKGCWRMIIWKMDS